MSCAMMVLILSILGSLSGLASSSKIQDHFSKVPMSDVASAIHKSCQEKHGATIEELELVVNLDHLSESRASKCMLACIVDVYGTFDDFGAPNINNLDLFFAVQFKPEARDLLMQIWVDCYVKVDRLQLTDNCEHHFQICQCFIDKVNADKFEKIKYEKRP